MRDLDEYFRPTSPEEALDIKRRYGPRAVFLAGGTDLLVHRPGDVGTAIDVRYTGMDEIGTDGEWFIIGAAARLRDVEARAGDVAGGMLRQAVRETAPWVIRNVATLVGNVINASPAADSVPALIALDAELVLVGDDQAAVPVAEMLTGPHQTKIGERLVKAIRIPRPAAGRNGAFFKISRSKSDIAQANVAVTMRLENGVARDVRIALGAVAPTAMRALDAERVLEGQEPTEALLRQLQEAVSTEVRPISDWRASAEFRRRVSGVYARRAVEHIVGAQRGISS